VAAAAFLWGTIGLAARALFAAGLTPLQAAVWRALGAFTLLFAYSLVANRRALAITLHDLPLFAAYGAVSVAGFMTVYFVAIELTTVATAAVLLYTAPVWVVVLARLIFHEPMTKMKAVAVGFAFLGCAMVIGVMGLDSPVAATGSAAGRLTPEGLLAGLGAGLTYALYSIFGKAALRRHLPLTTVVYSLGFGGLFLVIANGGLSRPPEAGLAPLVYVTLFPTAIAYLLYIGGLRWIEAGRASVVATLEPVVAALAGAFILLEPFGLLQWIGAALVIAGVVLVQTEEIALRIADRS
jgi:drug/metabolite transporter (DMT)-like permease